MRKRAAVLLLLLGLGVGGIYAVPAVTPGNQGKVAELVNQLGSANFRQREAAARELDAIGEPALEALRQASKSTDMETANRAAGLIAKIEQRMATAKLLAPTFVELSLKDVPVEKAVAELSKQSGYQIVLGGDRSKLNDRRVTIETGKVPFWQALDMLCAKANLVEGAANDPNVGVIDLPHVQPVPLPNPVLPVKPIRIRPLPPQKIEEPKPEPKPNEPQGFSADAPVEEAPKKKEVKPVQVQAQPVQIQIQAQPAIQIQPAPAIAPVQGGAIRPIGVVDVSGKTIVLVDGQQAAQPMHVEGAVRIRAVTDPNKLANFGPIPEREIGLLLDVRTEPKMQTLEILGVKIDKAQDNYEQNLDQSTVAANQGDPNDPAIIKEQIKAQAIKRIQIQPAIAPAMPFNGFGPGGAMQVPVRLKKADKETKSIKELKGTVTLKVQTPVEEILSVADIMKAKGETAKGKGDSSLNVLGVEKDKNGDVKVQFELRHSNELTPKNGQQSPFRMEFGNINGGAIQIQGQGGLQIQGNVQIQIGGGQGFINGVPANPGNGFGLELLDDKGVVIPIVGMQQTQMRFDATHRNMTATVSFRPKKDQEPAKLTFQGSHVATVDVPFILKDVPVK